MKTILTVILFSIAFISNAQDFQTSDSSFVIVHKDPRIDLLIKKQSSINFATKKAAGKTMRGYRLLVINTNSRDEAMDAKTKIYTYFPEIKSYLVYQAPFFKLKVGNFQTRDEAKKYQTMMNSLFPKGVFILNDTIEVKGEKETED
ncbi:MAG TPA: hypothetical protein VM368_04555 [Flavisolibacter sp.]|nr:hypothetical protein [Flavisolibacter sp.]